ncbi:hypothetical protein FF1_011759 [Malus domestica]
MLWSASSWHFRDVEKAGLAYLFLAQNKMGMPSVQNQFGNTLIQIPDRNPVQNSQNVAADYVFLHQNSRILTMFVTTKNTNCLTNNNGKNILHQILRESQKTVNL